MRHSIFRSWAMARRLCWLPPGLWPAPVLVCVYVERVDWRRVLWGSGLSTMLLGWGLRPSGMPSTRTSREQS